MYLLIGIPLVPPQIEQDFLQAIMHRNEPYALSCLGSSDLPMPDRTIELDVSLSPVPFLPAKTASFSR